MLSAAQQRQSKVRLDSHGLLPPAASTSVSTKTHSQRQHAQDQARGKACTSIKPDRDTADPSPVMSSAQLY